jgi:hypothetical protein
LLYGGCGAGELPGSLTEGAIIESAAYWALACVPSGIFGWRDDALYPLVRGVAEESDAADPGLPVLADGWAATDFYFGSSRLTALALARS